MDQQDIKHTIKPYLTNLSRQLHTLKPHIEQLTSKTLDEHLITLSNERDRLAFTNDFAYTLVSLLFAYGKVKSLDRQDMEKLLLEVSRVKEYMSRAQSLIKKEKEKEKERETRGPAISEKNFVKFGGTGRHTKFDDGDGDDDKDNDKSKESNDSDEDKRKLTKEMSKVVSRSRKQENSRNKVSKRR